MMEIGHMIELSVTASTIVLTHATYRAVPAEHKAKARHHLRLAARWTHSHLRWWVLWAAWTLTTPLRRGGEPVARRAYAAVVVAAFVALLIVVSWAMVSPALSTDRSEWGNNCPLNQ